MKLARYVLGETVRLMSESETLLLTVRKEGMGAVAVWAVAPPGRGFDK